MRRMILMVVLAMIGIATVSGCGGTKGPAWTTESFMLTGGDNVGVFDVHVDALEIMETMKRMQLAANQGRAVPEIYVVSIYSKAAGGKGKTKITKKKAQKALKKYRGELLARAGALPPLMPDTSLPTLSRND